MSIHQELLGDPDIQAAMAAVSGAVEALHAAVDRIGKGTPHLGAVLADNMAPRLAQQAVLTGLLRTHND